MALYQMTMELDGAYTERVFEAPSMEAAMKFAKEFPTTNGWSPGTKYRVGNYYPLEIDEAAKVIGHGAFYEYSEGFT